MKIIAISISLLLMSNIAAAVCLRSHSSVVDEYSESENVFMGKVLAEEAVPQSKDYYEGNNYTVQVQEIFKGHPTNPVVIFSENSSGRFPMTVGKTYLIFLRYELDKYQIDNCGNSGLQSEREDTIQTLQQLKRTQYDKSKGAKLANGDEPVIKTELKTNAKEILNGQIKTDNCDSLLPVSLKKAIAIRYPKYRIARSSNYRQEDLVMQYEKKTNPCPAIAFADVDGDGTLDYAILIVDASQHVVLIAARHPDSKAWRIDKLYDFRKGELGNLYVEAIKAGAYQDLYSDSPEYEEETGRLRRFTSKRPGFVAGAMESSGVAFFFSGKRWVHLWLSD